MDVWTQSFKSRSASSRTHVRILSTPNYAFVLPLRNETKLKGLQEIVVTRLSKSFANSDTQSYHKKKFILFVLLACVLNTCQCFELNLLL